MGIREVAEAQLIERHTRDTQRLPRTGAAAGDQPLVVAVYGEHVALTGAQEITDGQVLRSNCAGVEKGPVLLGAAHVPPAVPASHKQVVMAVTIEVTHLILAEAAASSG